MQGVSPYNSGHRYRTTCLQAATCSQDMLHITAECGSKSEYTIKAAYKPISSVRRQTDKGNVHHH